MSNPITDHTPGGGGEDQCEKLVSALVDLPWASGGLADLWGRDFRDAMDGRRADIRKVVSADLAAPTGPEKAEPVAWGVPSGWKLVPEKPTEAMWDGLARQLVLWRDLSSPTGEALYRHLRRSGKDIPLWLRYEIPDMPGVPPKGSVAVAIYRAMLEAAPTPPAASRPAVGRGFDVGQRVRKVSGSSWHGKVVGHYSTDLTPDGICVESEREPGSVQVYPAKALALLSDPSETQTGPGGGQ